MIKVFPMLTLLAPHHFHGIHGGSILQNRNTGFYTAPVTIIF